MTQKYRKKYSNEFKRKVVGYYVANSISMSEVAAQFGITTGMLHKWHKSLGDGFLDDYSNLEKKVRWLALELEKTKKDVNVLRKIVRKKIVEQAMSGSDRELLGTIT